MRILYCGISSKYIHTMPAGWFLAEYLLSKGICIEEYYSNVNEEYNKILTAITSKQYDMYLFSAYIFNINVIKMLIMDIKNIYKDSVIVVGGPEACEEIDADHIIMGEGEIALYKLILSGGNKLIYEEQLDNLDDIPTPYTRNRLDSSANKLVYYESSRGCPFSCTYCMASLSLKKVRYFSIERVKSDLTNIVNYGAKIIKFTDRTFNASASRANVILKFISDKFSNKNVCFHIEVGGDLFNDDTLEILKNMPTGLLQIECGVQTLNLLSLKAVSRPFNTEKFMSNIKKIISFNNIHTHLDLIAGLPHDSLDTFKTSYDTIIKLKPHTLQLGFLKMLLGTPLRASYNAEYNCQPPYEVISTPTMSRDDLITLKNVEWITDKLYNSGRFYNTLNYLLYGCVSAFNLFYDISQHFIKIGIKKSSYLSTLYDGLYDYMDDKSIASELLRLDFYITNNSNYLPNSLKRDRSQTFKSFLKTYKNSDKYKYEEFAINPINLNRILTIIRFNYAYKNPVNMQYGYEIIDNAINI